MYKLIGTNTASQLNSGSIKAQAIFDDAVLYPNPYVVVTSKGYTKHYYVGTERIATVIGGGGFGDMVSPTDKLSSQHDQDIVKTFYTRYLNYDPFFHQGTLSQPEKTEDIHGNPHPDLEYQCTPTELVMVDILNPPDILQKSIAINGQINYKEDEIYFYHGDHLGSANWITDYTGAPIQYIHYAPYGELIDNQVPYGYDERYKFTGKERDAETGYDFFGARFYWQAGTWLSVDPLAGDNPQISPYAYCAWNPIGFIDPDGREVINEIDETKDPDLYAVANAHQAIDDDNSTITLYAHGSENSIELRDGTTISTAEQFEEYLSNNSTLWNSSENKKNLSIVLMSCNTGNMHAEGSPIAEQISKLLGNIVFAPTTEVATKDGSFYGLYRMEHIDPITHRGTVKPDLDHMGNWQAFTSQGSIELDYRASNLRFGWVLLDFLVKICGYEK